MRPTEFVVIRPHLQEAIDDVDAYLTRKQALENDKKLHELFNRLAKKEQARLRRLAKKEQAKPRRLAKKEQANNRLVASPKGKPSKAKFCKLTKKEQAKKWSPGIGGIGTSPTMPLIEHAYPWRHSVVQAEVDLRDCGWTKEAEAIDEVLSGLPTGPVDGMKPDNMDRQFDTIRAGAERIKTILTACLSPPDASESRLGKTMPIEAPGDRQAHHGIDFRSVDWFGESYAFTPTQAACVKVLWEHWEQDTPEVGDQTILEVADSTSNRLDSVFKDCPAWGTMIVPGKTKGTRRLSPADGPK